MQYDILIKNATIYDGTNSRSYRSNIVIKDGKILKIGELVDEHLCSSVIDADKRFVCPGFIDIDNVSDHYLTLFSNPKCDNLLRQGITTIIIGQEGSSLAPLIKNRLSSFETWTSIDDFNTSWRSFKAFLAFLNSKRFGVNVGSLIGWNTIRSGLIGESFKNLSDYELKQLLILVKQSIKDGALGVSFGLGYSSGRAISKREILAVANEIKKFKTLFSFYLRDDSFGFLNAVQEILEIVVENEINTLISNFKVQNEENFMNFDKALKLIEVSNTKDKKLIHFDIDPYDYVCQPLINLMPDWLAIGGKDVVKSNLLDKDIVKKLIKELKQNKGFYKKLILVDIDKKYRIFKGKTFEKIASNMGVSIEEAIVKILTLTQKKVIVLNQSLSISNIDKGVKNAYGIIASNGMSTDINNFSEYFCDQRSIGTFPKYLSQYMKVLPFETLVYKITGLVKEKLNLKDKGYIKIGMDADIVILNSQTLADQSTMQNPVIAPKGIEMVIVNGKVVLNKGDVIDGENGKIIIRS